MPEPGVPMVEEKAQRHPIAMIFFWTFKASPVQVVNGSNRGSLILNSQSAAVAWFILCGFFVDSFILNFVVSLILVALDFWTVRTSAQAPLHPFA